LAIFIIFRVGEGKNGQEALIQRSKFERISLLVKTDKKRRIKIEHR